MSLKQFTTSIPMFGGLFDDTQEKTMEQLAQNQSLYNGLAMPSFDVYTPEEYRLAGQLTPEQMEAQLVSEDPRLKSAQSAYLAKLAGLSEDGMTAQDAAAFNKAEKLGLQLASSGSQAAIQNAQARGVAGSGMEFMMREMANQSGADRAQQAGLEQAAETARQRALYTQAYGSALSGQRDQDYRGQANNTNILNQFNQMNTQARNDAQQWNLGQRQAVQNANTEGRNNAVQYNNQMKQQGYQNQLSRLAGLSGANTGMAQGYAAQNAANSSDRNANTALLAEIGMSAMGGGSKKKPTTSSID